MCVPSLAINSHYSRSHVGFFTKDHDLCSSSYILKSFRLGFSPTVCVQSSSAVAPAVSRVECKIYRACYGYDKPVAYVCVLLFCFHLLFWYHA